MTYAELEAVFRRHMYFAKDPDELLVVVSVILAQRLDSLPLWLFYVAPSGGGKSAILEATQASPDKVYLSDHLTPRTLISAYKEPGQKGGPNPEHSLLYKINNKTLIVPDFMSITEMDIRDRKTIFGQLRQAFSGRFHRDTGVGSVNVKSKFNMICGGTQDIDRFRENEVAMGERFLIYRSRQVGGRELGQRILRAVSDDWMNLELMVAMGEFLGTNEIEPTTPIVSPEVGQLLLHWSQMVVRLRNAVHWDTYQREISYPVETAEEYSRILKQFKSMVYALMMTSEDPRRALRILAKIAIDCVPLPRIKAIRGVRHGVTCSEDLRQRFMKTGRSSHKKVIEELEVLGILQVRGQTAVLSSEFEEFFDEIAYFIDTPEELAR